MTQSSRAVGRGQKKGRNVPVSVPPPPSFTMATGGSAPSASSEAIGASIPSNNPAVAKQ